MDSFFLILSIGSNDSLEITLFLLETTLIMYGQCEKLTIGVNSIESIVGKPRISLSILGFNICLCFGFFVNIG
jgi:hypothetical protein